MSISDVKHMVDNGFGDYHRLIIANIVYRELKDNGAYKLISEWFNRGNGYLVNDEIDIVLELNNDSPLARLFSILAVANTAGIICDNKDFSNSQYKDYRFFLLNKNGSISKSTYKSYLSNNPYIIPVNKHLYYYSTEYSRVDIRSIDEVYKQLIVLLMYKKNMAFYTNGSIINSEDIKKKSMLGLYEHIKSSKVKINNYFTNIYKELDLWNLKY